MLLLINAENVWKGLLYNMIKRLVFKNKMLTIVRLLHQYDVTVVNKIIIFSKIIGMFGFLIYLELILCRKKKEL